MSDKILIIDDEPNILLSFSSLLEDEGYRSLTADSAEDGLKIFSRQGASLVLLDLNLPGWSGIDFLKKLNYKRK